MDQSVHRGYYAIIPANVRYDKELTPNAKLLYGEITALCNEKGFCWAGNAYFAELYGVSKNSISKWISSLQQRGYIEVTIIYKLGSKEIESRHLRISERPTHENFHTPIHEKVDTYPRNLPYSMDENFTDNNKVINTKKEYTLSKDNVTQKSLIPSKSKKTKKAQDIDTMKKMILAFTQNENIREKLNEYFRIRLKKGLEPNQWSIILDDLRKYAGDNANLATEKINGAIAGGYMQIIAAWEKDKAKNVGKSKFDNTAGSDSRAVVNMTDEEREKFEEDLVKDESGNLVQF